MMPESRDFTLVFNGLSRLLLTFVSIWFAYNATFAFDHRHRWGRLSRSFDSELNGSAGSTESREFPYTTLRAPSENYSTRFFITFPIGSPRIKTIWFPFCSFRARTLSARHSISWNRQGSRILFRTRQYVCVYIHNVTTRLLRSRNDFRRRPAPTLPTRRILVFRIPTGGLRGWSIRRYRILRRRNDDVCTRVCRVVLFAAFASCTTHTHTNMVSHRTRRIVLRLVVEAITSCFFPLLALYHVARSRHERSRSLSPVKGTPTSRWNERPLKRRRVCGKRQNGFRPLNVGKIDRFRVEFVGKRFTIGRPNRPGEGGG